MELSETTFDEFVAWCKEHKHEWYNYMTIPRLRIMFDYCVKHGLKCEGNRLRVSWKNNEFVSSLAEPLGHKAKREDFIWDLFHEVWCKAEWAIRCGRSEMELGYSSVVSEFGKKTIEALREAE